MYRLTLSLPGVPKSLNRALRTHHRGRSRDNAAWDNEIAAECHGKKPPQPLPRAKISITRHAHRMLDFDGLVGSLKPVVDALVTAGVLADDSWKVTGGWHVDQKYRPERMGPLLEILVYELPSEVV